MWFHRSWSIPESGKGESAVSANAVEVSVADMITGLVAANRGAAPLNSELISNIPVTAVIEVTNTPSTSLVRVVVRVVRVGSDWVRFKVQAQHRGLLDEDTMTIGCLTRMT